MNLIGLVFFKNLLSYVINFPITAASGNMQYLLEQIYFLWYNLLVSFIFYLILTDVAQKCFIYNSSKFEKCSRIYYCRFLRKVKLYNFMYQPQFSSPGYLEKSQLLPTIPLRQGNHVLLTFRHRATPIQDRRFATLQRMLFIYLINKYISLTDICLTGHH